MGFEEYLLQSGEARAVTAAEVFLANVMRLRRYRIRLKSTGEWKVGVPALLSGVDPTTDGAEFTFSGDDDRVYSVPFSDLESYEEE